jgi:general secretion pathway protein C
MDFGTALKRYFGWVILALIAIAAYFQAAGITQLVGTSLAADEKALASLPPSNARPSTATVTDDHATNARPILDRNPFDSTSQRPLDAPPPVEDGGEAPPIDLEHYENAPPCEGMKALIVLSAPTAGEWSMAALTPPGSNDAKLVRVGEEVGGKTVQIIEWNRVVLSTGSTICQLQMFKPIKLAGVGPAPSATAPAAAATAPPPPQPSGGPGAVSQEIASHIQRVSATEFNVDKQVVDKILENQAELMRMARIVPEQENGKVVGIRLFGVRPDTLLGTLGMENGDRLQSINGFDMTSPEKALEAYARLRTSDHLTVQVNRRGQNTNLDYNIK